jgi:hypothetical protein
MIPSRRVTVVPIVRSVATSSAILIRAKISSTALRIAAPRREPLAIRLRGYTPSPILFLSNFSKEM